MYVSDQDGAEPSANSVSAMNLVRLASMVNQPTYAQQAQAIFSCFSHRLTKVPMVLPLMVCAMAFANSHRQVSARL